MSYHQLLLIGDSNVARFLPTVKSSRKDQELQATSMWRATNLVQLKEKLATPEAAAEHVVVAALTNVITSHVYVDSATLTAYCANTFSAIMNCIEAGRAHLPGAHENVSQLSVANHRWGILVCTIRFVFTVYDFCFTYQVYVLPPMLRRTPYWFHRYFDVVMCAFEDVFSQPIPGLSVLPAYPNPEMSVDGIHLTPQSGPR